MTADNLATAIYIGLASLVIVGLGSAAFRWAARDVERHVQIALGEQAADFREPTRTEIEADFFWAHYFADWDQADDATEAQADRVQRDAS